MKPLILIVLIGILILVAAGCQRSLHPPADLLIATSDSGVDKQTDPQTYDKEEGQLTESSVTSTPRVRVTASPTPTRTAPDNTAVQYTVRPGDNLLRIAIAYGTTLESLMAINGLSNADQISVGQVLQVSFDAQYIGPGELLIPDSELVNSPAYSNFRAADYITSQRGYLATYSEAVGLDMLTGAEIIDLVAKQYSVGPRVLLALLELKAGWVTEMNPDAASSAYPLGYTDMAYYSGLYHQLSVAADSLNTGFYGWQQDDLWMVHTRDGAFIQFSDQINAGTAGLQRALAGSASSYELWLADIEHFDTVYRRLFGNPFDYAVEPIVSPEAEAVALTLPWASDETWYFTGGPHAGYGTIGAGSAVDFVTPERNIGCMVSQYWATAAIDGLVAYSYDGLVMIDHDSDGDLSTGWVLVYMHMATDGRVEQGSMVKTGDRIGHPSCEGGVSNASHLHFARRYNGMWIPADDERWPMLLSGWRAIAGAQAYEGEFARNGVTQTACECWDDGINGLNH